MITKQQAAATIEQYLHHEITLPHLVDWAEQALMDAEIAPEAMSTLPQVLARIGVADVRAFGLTFDDCEALLEQLGYSIRLDVVAA